METTYIYLAASGVLTLLLWSPYILSRMLSWGIPTFLNNYPPNYPAEEPTPPLWAQRAKRAHLNLVETLPALVAVVIAAASIAPATSYATINQFAAIFFFARLVHAAVYILGVPYLRTPSYLVSWAAVLVIGYQCFV